MGVDIKAPEKAEEKKERELGVGGLVLLGIIIWVLFPPKPPKLYECPYCDATFETKAELDAHIEAEHPGEPDDGIKPEVSVLGISWL